MMGQRVPWPYTPNRHVLISRRTALGVDPISQSYLQFHLGRSEFPRSGGASFGFAARGDRRRSYLVVDTAAICLNYHRCLRFG